MHKGVRVNQSFDLILISFTVLSEASCSPQIRIYTGIRDRSGPRRTAAWRPGGHVDSVRQTMRLPFHYYRVPNRFHNINTITHCDCYGLVLPLAASGSYRYTYIRDDVVVSQELGNTRDLVMFTPPSYYENPFKTFLDLLIMHDGQNLCNASTSCGGVAWQVRLCRCVSSFQAPRFTWARII